MERITNSKKGKASELTLEILEETQLPPVKYPKRIRVSYGDYRRLREACDKTEQPGGYILYGEWIMPDIDIGDNDYEVDW